MLKYLKHFDWLKTLKCQVEMIIPRYFQIKTNRELIKKEDGLAPLIKLIATNHPDLLVNVRYLIQDKVPLPKITSKFLQINEKYELNCTVGEKRIFLKKNQKQYGNAR